MTNTHSNEFATHEHDQQIADKLRQVIAFEGLASRNAEHAKIHEAEAKKHKMAERKNIEAAEHILGEIAAIMAEAGEPVHIVRGQGANYKLSYTTPRGSIKVTDDAVPDEFCRIKREPDRNKIKEWLEAGNASNWAWIETPPAKLTYKPLKV